MIKQVAAAGLLAATVTGLASAGDVTGNVGLTTNYIFRGITQTDNGPAVSGGFDVEKEGFYGGIWASSVDFSDATTMELDFYGGYTFSAGDFDLDFGAIYYAYPDSPEYFGESQDFMELYFGAGRELGPVAVDVKFSWSDDFYAGTGEALYAEIGAAFELVEGITADARFGSSTFDDLAGADYEDWQVGVSGEAFGVGWDVRYHDTSDFFDDSFVFSISQSFGG